MQDHDTQRELLQETVSSTKALEMAIHMEMGPQNQQKINENTNSTAHSFNAVNSFQGRNCNANYKPARKHSAQYPTFLQNYSQNPHQRMLTRPIKLPKKR